jgi:hypothetical protein
MPNLARISRACDGSAEDCPKGKRCGSIPTGNAGSNGHVFKRYWRAEEAAKLVMP